MAELGQPDPDVAERAALRLAAAGRRAGDRLDYRAALALLSRAVELLRPHRLDVALELEAAWRMMRCRWPRGRRRSGCGCRARRGGERPARVPCSLAPRRRSSGGSTAAIVRPASWTRSELCRTALPLEEERGDPRRLALLWRVLAYAANFRMQNNEHAEAAERELHYSRLAGDSPSDTAGLDWALILGPRPADEALRAFEEIGEGRPPGASDFGRATSARDARPHRRSMAARGGAVESPA